VEHFRPKRKYFWLAYEWDNLLLSCHDCNNSKSEHFPIADESARARGPADDHKTETPLLLNPVCDDLCAHFEWVGTLIASIGIDSRAETTIATLALNREQLIANREEHLGWVKELVLIANNLAFPETTRQRALTKIRQATSADRPYSAMVESYVAAMKTA